MCQWALIRKLKNAGPPRVWWGWGRAGSSRIPFTALRDVPQQLAQTFQTPPQTPLVLQRCLDAAVMQCLKLASAITSSNHATTVSAAVLEMSG